MKSSPQINIETQLAPYYQIIDRELQHLEFKPGIPLFYDPIRYFLTIPGKRIRPLLVLLAAEALGQDVQQARFAAIAVELLHNFTLVHDDIMDNDDTRRGQQTVHKRWDIPTAILAGDGLMGFAFQQLLRTTSADRAALAERFTEAMIVICEGQGQDKMFETEEQISETAYLEMIDRKTAVLLQLSCEMGAMIAGASRDEVELFKTYGHALGMGFQVQDDLLDIMGETSAIGKMAGSDLSMHKQTILTIKLQPHLGGRTLWDLTLEEYRALLRESGVLQEVEELVQGYFNSAYEQLAKLADGKAKDLLLYLTEFIQQRKL